MQVRSDPVGDPSSAGPGSGLYEKRFAPEYQFMKVVREGDEETYRIDWKDVVLLLESPTRKYMRIR